MRKVLNKIFVLLFLPIIVITVLYFFDVSDRGILYSRHIPNDIFEEFYLHKTTEDVQEAYIKNFNNPKYNFPREKIDKIKIYKNSPFISRLTSKTISKKTEGQILTLFNSPNNFSWSETTWSLKESAYILRFFDINNNEIGKLWLCLDSCGMVETIPFTPNIKYGSLNELGTEKLNQILVEIYN